MYPRIGSNDGLISNISQGGYICDINTFLKKEFPKNDTQIYNKLQKVALTMVEHINTFFTVSIDELGLDFSIDQTGDLWLFEINTRPQTRYFQLEHAKNSISYAAYLSNKNQKVSKVDI